MNGMSYQDLNAVYENREKLFLQREQEQKQMKESLNHLFEVVKQEKSALELTAREQAEKAEEQKKKEQEMQAWYKDLLELKNQTVQEKKLVEEEKTAFLAEKEQAEMRVRVQTEQVKNESILAKQKQEEFEHKLEMLGLLLGQEGKDAGHFFEALMQAVPADTEEDIDLLEKEIARLKEEKQALLGEQTELQEENKTLQEENTVLKAKNETLEKSAEKYEEEKKGLLGLIAEFTKQAENVPKFGTEEQQKENVPKFGTEKQGKKKTVESVAEEQNHQSASESVTRKRMKQNVFASDEAESIDGYVPKFGTKASADEEVFEELTATVLEKYLKKNEPHCTSSQIRHSKQGEQLHVVIDQLEHAFLFYQPAMFEISKPKKKSRELERLLARLNNEHPGIKFYYDAQEERVYATGYFSNTMSPDKLMQLVHTVSDCFRK